MEKIDVPVTRRWMFSFWKPYSVQAQWGDLIRLIDIFLIAVVLVERPNDYIDSRLNMIMDYRANVAELKDSANKMWARKSDLDNVFASENEYNAQVQGARRRSDVDITDFRTYLCIARNIYKAAFPNERFHDRRHDVKVALRNAYGGAVLYPEDMPVGFWLTMQTEEQLREELTLTLPDLGQGAVSDEDVFWRAAKLFFPSRTPPPVQKDEIIGELSESLTRASAVLPAQTSTSATGLAQANQPATQRRFEHSPILPTGATTGSYHHSGSEKRRSNWGALPQPDQSLEATTLQDFSKSGHALPQPYHVQQSPESGLPGPRFMSQTFPYDQPLVYGHGMAPDSWGVNQRTSGDGASNMRSSLTSIGEAVHQTPRYPYMASSSTSVMYAPGVNAANRTSLSNTPGTSNVRSLDGEIEGFERLHISGSQTAPSGSGYHHAPQSSSTTSSVPRLSTASSTGTEGLVDKYYYDDTAGRGLNAAHHAPQGSSTSTAVPRSSTASTTGTVTGFIDNYGYEYYDTAGRERTSDGHY
ncbi:hypothetical protein D9613_008033 [Agrocybe pediades]|uniref:Uncharacterized protein n=1 Tax=Agrocybe pediades TaxID=84607 RepID=A0A8H4VK02_9AGAR|nr:hypothetical protein D9613_008033 [Agrocybe pediades]